MFVEWFGSSVFEQLCPSIGVSSPENPHWCSPVTPRSRRTTLINPPRPLAGHVVLARGYVTNTASRAAANSTLRDSTKNIWLLRSTVSGDQDRRRLRTDTGWFFYRQTLVVSVRNFYYACYNVFILFHFRPPS